VIDQFALS
jgi:hypothetical protein